VVPATQAEWTAASPNARDVVLKVPVMSLAARRTLQTARIFRRYNSSRRGPSEKGVDPCAVAPDKMRALIELYHQSNTFITPENLSRRIDEAFIDPDTHSSLAAVKRKMMHDNYRTLTDQVQERRRMPRIGSMPPPIGMTTQDLLWSRSRTTREATAQAALFGTSEWAFQRPGLEELQAESEEIQEQLQEDQENLGGM
jgi:hypothetical protein